MYIIDRTFIFNRRLYQKGYTVFIENGTEKKLVFLGDLLVEEMTFDQLHEQFFPFMHNLKED